jgi:hypothetical protein
MVCRIIVYPASPQSKNMIFAVLHVSFVNRSYSSVGNGEAFTLDIDISTDVLPTCGEESEVRRVFIMFCVCARESSTSHICSAIDSLLRSLEDFTC